MAEKTNVIDSEAMERRKNIIAFLFKAENLSHATLMINLGLYNVVS